MDRFFQMLAKAADGAFVIDESQRIIYWNDAAQEILGYTSEEVVGRACYEVLSGCDDRSQVICRHQCSVVTATLQGSVVTNYDSCTCTKSGELRWINVSILTIPTSSNKTPPFIVHLFRDVTQKKQNEQFARQVLDAAKHLQDVTFPNPLPKQVKPPVEKLTAREREILSLLAQGSNTHDIAQSLSISSFTVRNHIQNILNKLHVHSRLEAVTYALEHGLVPKD
jgi:PAS domain S-box-containing protein